MRFLLPLLASALLSTAIGCAAETPENTASDEAPVVGVTDLSAMEAELGLTVDATGSRSHDTLVAGPCYQRTIGSIYGGLFEYRQYTKGAAFFPKHGTVPGTGDQRAVYCVDVDVPALEPGRETTVALDGIALDLALRYELGAPSANEFFVGHSYAMFAHGRVETGFGDHFCGGSPAVFGGFQSPINPASPASTKAGYDACMSAFATDVANDTIDRPAFDGDRYFYDLSLDAERFPLSGSLTSLVYRYAQRSAIKVDAFTLSGDPVGRLVHSEKQHARFEHLDAHDVTANGVQTIAITPKLSDGDIAGRAVALCTRTVSIYGVVTSAFSCRGL